MKKNFYIISLGGVKIWFSTLEDAKIYKYDRIYNKEGELAYSPYEGE